MILYLYTRIYDFNCEIIIRREYFLYISERNISGETHNYSDYGKKRKKKYYPQKMRFKMKNVS